MTEHDDLRARLIEERELVLERVAKFEVRLSLLTRDRRGQSDDDEHDPEGDTLSAQWSLHAGLLESARDSLRQADAAMKRLEAGTYGVCLVCGGMIPPEQLEVMPFREHCVGCG